jgi:hypothetical protein
VKITLSKAQISLLNDAHIHFENDKDYDDDALIKLEDDITNYVVENEFDTDDKVTERGGLLLDLHDFIVTKYDS